MTVLTRRKLLRTAAIAGAGGIGLSAVGKVGSWAAATPEPVLLKTARIQAKLMDVGQTKNVLTYGDAGMPPVIRMKKGEPFAARLVNAIDDPTTIHWHGIRVPNKMDGVPFLVQPYVYTGDHFDYAFTPPDAGTFWYHPHCNTLEQMGHGLTGVIVVENPNDPQFDAEVVINLRDWRLGDDGAVHRPVPAARRRKVRHLRHGAHRQLAATSRNMTRRPEGWCGSGPPSPTSRASMLFASRAPRRW